MKKASFWTSVSDHLLMFPLTQPVRVVLLEMLCIGTKPYQVPILSTTSSHCFCFWLSLIAMPFIAPSDVLRGNCLVIWTKFLKISSLNKLEKVM